MGWTPAARLHFLWCNMVSDSHDELLPCSKKRKPWCIMGNIVQPGSPALRAEWNMGLEWQVPWDIPTSFPRQIFRFSAKSFHPKFFSFWFFNEKEINIFHGKQNFISALASTATAVRRCSTEGEVCVYEWGSIWLLLSQRNSSGLLQPLYSSRILHWKWGPKSSLKVLKCFCPF